jgi:hypothetical protein
MGWEEMLEQSDRKALATSYVRGVFFGKVLEAWVRQGGGNSAETNETVRWRSKTQHELTELLMIEIVEGALQLAADWNDESRERTAGEWRARIDTDMVLQNMLKVCLDDMAEVVGAGIQTQSAWGFVWACVKKGESGALIPDRKCLDTVLEEITKYRRERAAGEMGAVAGVDDRGEQKKRIRALLDAAKEVRVETLETALRILTTEFKGHVTNYNLDKVSLKLKFEEIDAKMETEVGVLTSNLGRVEKGIAHDNNIMRALTARVGVLEQIKSTPTSKKKWWHVGADAAAGAETEKRIGALLGELERLSS